MLQNILPHNNENNMNQISLFHFPFLFILF